MKVIIGSILILLVVTLYIFWLWSTGRQKGVSAKESGGVQVFNIIVKGVYSPSVIRAKAGRPVRIDFKREEANECSRFINFPDFKIRRELPEGKIISIEFTPERVGNFLFTCDMSMYQGRLIIE
jgi:plastocyanin domain-containing protein